MLWLSEFMINCLIDILNIEMILDMAPGLVVLSLPPSAASSRCGSPSRNMRRSGNSRLTENAPNLNLKKLQKWTPNLAWIILNLDEKYSQGRMLEANLQKKKISLRQNEFSVPYVKTSVRNRMLYLFFCACNCVISNLCTV